MVGVICAVFGFGALLLLAVRVARSPLSQKGGASYVRRSPGGRPMRHLEHRPLVVEDYVPEELLRARRKR